jgi:small-conductance mechanosensitive channel/CRP-like cAMP-binding protein
MQLFGSHDLLAATIAIVIIAVLRVGRERNKLLQPLLIYGAYLIAYALAVSLVPEPLRRAAELTESALLIIILGQLVLTLLSSVLYRGFGIVITRIYFDLAMGAILLTALISTLSLAGFKSGELLPAAAVISLAAGVSLKDTLGNLVAGLAIYTQRPFSIGEWIQFDDKREHIGKVREIGWRATSLVTLDAVEVVIPNSNLSALPLTNYSRPEGKPRRSIYFVCPYTVPPKQVHRIVLAAVRGAAGVCETPIPSIVTNAFTERGIEYWLRFHTTEFDRRDGVDGGVRDRIWYALHRHGLGFSIQSVAVQIDQASDEDIKQEHQSNVDRRKSLLRDVSLFQSLNDDLLWKLAEHSMLHSYVGGEVIIRQGDEGSELFVIRTGTVDIIVRNHEGQESTVRQLGRHDFFGEMSLLVGEPRTATVRAAADCELLVVNKSAMSHVLSAAPELVNEISRTVTERRMELNDTKNRSITDAQSAPETLLDRIKRYFQI